VAALRRQDPGELLAEARRGSRPALARLLTYAESTGDLHDATVALTYRAEPAYVVGLTGAPGAGKSTLTDQLLRSALANDPTTSLAVLCIDPTSPFSGGALLGDRIRMQDHATDERVFIRSLATRGQLGGLSLGVPDALHVLSAVGYPRVLVETVGVGQMEVDIAAAADTTVVVVNPGWGDAMQASKAGLLEIADVFVINKADRAGVLETRRDLEQMLDFSHEGWRPPIVEVVATEGRGVDDVWAAINRHRSVMAGGELDERRRRRAQSELNDVVGAMQQRQLEELTRRPEYAEIVDALVARTIDPYEAARQVLSMG